MSPKREKTKPSQMARAYESAAKVPGRSAAARIRIVVSGLKK
jgi:hypothetical protein